MLQKARTLLRTPIINHKTVLPRKQLIFLDGNSLDLDKLSLLGAGNGDIDISQHQWRMLENTRRIVDEIA